MQKRKEKILSEVFGLLHKDCGMTNMAISKIVGCHRDTVSKHRKTFDLHQEKRKHGVDTQFNIFVNNKPSVIVSVDYDAERDTFDIKVMPIEEYSEMSVFGRDAIENVD